MIELRNVSKSFRDNTAVNNISMTVEKGSIFGLAGSNGAGKSTILRMIAGILKPDTGQVTIDGEDVYKLPKARGRMCFLSDTPYFFPNAFPRDMADYYTLSYPDFDRAGFETYLKNFQLPYERKISSYSKGQKRLVSVLLGLCAGTEYLICDELMDGLDPVVKQAFKSLLAGEVESRRLTVILASHNLREIEDICDVIGLIHNGEMILSEDIDELKLNMCKVQFAVGSEIDKAVLLNRLDIMEWNTTGSLNTLTVKGSSKEALDVINSLDPVWVEVLPLTLDEIFISETEAIGYEIKDISL